MADLSRRLAAGAVALLLLLLMAAGVCGAVFCWPAVRVIVWAADWIAGRRQGAQSAAKVDWLL